MNHRISVSPCFRTLEVKTFLTDLIHHQEYGDYRELSFPEKCELVSLLMKGAGPFSDHEFFYESNDLHSTMSFFRKALSGTHEDDENFVLAMKNHAIKYYEEIMTWLFNDALRDYECAHNEWMARRAKYGDPDEAYETYLSQLEWNEKECNQTI